MIVVITKYGRTPLGLNYTDAALKKVVKDFLTTDRDAFNYGELYNYVMNRGIHDDMFETEPYTRYLEIALTQYDEHRLSIILWQMIWAHELFIEFRNNNLNHTNDTVFGVMKNNK